MKFRQVVKILKNTRWAIDINCIPISYEYFWRTNKGYFATGCLFELNKISRKELLKGIQQAKTIHIWGYGKFPKLVLKMMKFYENKGKLIDEDEALQLITHWGGSNEQ